MERAPAQLIILGGHIQPLQLISLAVNLSHGHANDSHIQLQQEGISSSHQASEWWGAVHLKYPAQVIRKAMLLDPTENLLH